MTRYFFDLMRESVVIRRDVVGRELRDLEMARAEALNFWNQAIEELSLSDIEPFDLTVAIYDPHGKLLATVPQPRREAIGVAA